jgi:ElaB/YqjD/DUF883 family membrane-anchored ribosome-binding protein
MPDRDDVKKSSAAPGEAAKDAQKDVRQDMETAKSTVSDDLESTKREIGAQAAGIGEEARQQAQAATDQAKSYMGRQKDFAAEQIEDVADAMRKAADDIENPTVAGYTRDLAGGLSRFSEGVRSRSFDEVVAAAADFGRRQPVAFLGAAALMGFAASRFVKASTQRHDTARLASGEELAGSEYAPSGIPSTDYGETRPAETSVGAIYGERH